MQFTLYRWHSNRRPIPWAALALFVVLNLATAAPGRAQTAAAPDPRPAPKAEVPPREEHPFPRREPAPRLDADASLWLNTAGPLELRDLRGKFVILDFWTYCCINCIHILPELKKLERAYPNELVVIGVHSAKFETEKDLENIRAAVLRYEIEHPVVNDADHRIWNNFFVSSWPSLRVIDPEGNLVAVNSGEVTFDVLDGFLKRALPYYEQQGKLNRDPLQFNLEAMQAKTTPLRFPGKILADEPSKRLFITDSNHNRIVIADLDGQVLDVLGDGGIGRADGSFETCRFDHPQGLALRGKTLYIADTENHLLRKADLERRVVTTIAGVGEQARGGWPGMDQVEVDATGRPRDLPDRWVGPPAKSAINSPWALWIHEPDLYIAMAGPHQIWKMPLDESEIGPYAGNGREDIVDGPLLPSVPYQQGFSSFAQPSGLASDGKRLFVADSEGSAIRSVPFSPDGQVRTIIGTLGSLFQFGDVDGKYPEARLQHALGVTFYEGKLYVADTYNNKVKRIDPAKQMSETLAGDGTPGLEDNPPRFDEPAGIAAAHGKLYVADTNNHAIRVIDLRQNNRVSTLVLAGLASPHPAVKEQRDPFREARKLEAPAAVVSASQGQIDVSIQFQLPPDWKINPLGRQSYRITNAGEQKLLAPAALGLLQTAAEPTDKLQFSLPLAAKSGQATLEIGVQYYYCREGAEGICKADQVVLTVPVSVDEKAPGNLIELSIQPPAE